MKMRHGRALGFSLFLMLIVTAGCSHFAHYPLNAPLDRYEPGYGYLARNMGPEGNSEELLLILSFSGGGTRAAAFSYGVLEELRATEVAFDGRKRRLVDEVDMISGVSGGSFTAAYYGLFGERIFEDYEGRFLKKNVQGDLKSSMFLNPVNWFRLSSPFFDRSDLAAEYYDKYVFDGKTFGDILRRKGPMILINTTDMSLGVRITFNQNLFNAICSDLSKFPVARACAASSAWPISEAKRSMNISCRTSAAARVQSCASSIAWPMAASSSSRSSFIVARTSFSAAGSPRASSSASRHSICCIRKAGAILVLLASSASIPCNFSRYTPRFTGCLSVWYASLTCVAHCIATRCSASGCAAKRSGCTVFCSSR